MSTQGHNRDVVVLSGKRTGFGTFGGSLKALSATDLGVIASSAALEAAGVAPDTVDHTFFGNALQTSADAIFALVLDETLINFCFGGNLCQ